MPAYDMSQMSKKETEDDYHSRPLFPIPSITKIISRHAGTVLDSTEPKVVLNAEESESFDSVFMALSGDRSGEDTGGESNLLPYSKFSDLLSKLKIKLSKDQYIELVEPHLSTLDNNENHRHHQNHAHAADNAVLEVNRHQALALYCKVYAPSRLYGSRFRTATARGDKGLMESLALRGCDVNSADGNGHTPLHHASFYGRKEVVKILVDLGKSTGGAGKAGKEGKEGKHNTNGNGLVIDAKDNRGWTPLMSASSNGCLDFCRALLDAKADASETNLEGRTPLHIAAGKGKEKVVKLLLSLSSGNKIVNFPSKRGWTPLFEACIHGHEEVIRMLVKGGGDAQAKDMMGFGCDKYFPEEGGFERIVSEVGGKRK